MCPVCGGGVGIDGHICSHVHDVCREHISKRRRIDGHICSPLTHSLSLSHTQTQTHTHDLPKAQHRQSLRHMVNASEEEDTCNTGKV
jgi:hypothetical protein